MCVLLPKYAIYTYIDVHTSIFSSMYACFAWPLRHVSFVKRMRMPLQITNSIDYGADKRFFFKKTIEKLKDKEKSHNG